MIPEDNRFHSDPDGLLADSEHWIDGWRAEPPDPTDEAVVVRLTELLRAHERSGRGWAAASVDDVLAQVSARSLRMRENVVLRDPAGEVRAWGSVHDRAQGRMLFGHVVDRSLSDGVAEACSSLLFSWAEQQARAVGAARDVDVQQIDTGAFADDDRQHGWLEAAGFRRVRRWLQMSRPVTADEAGLVPDPAGWRQGRVTIRLVRRTPDGLPDAVDVQAVHQVLEEAFRDHFNSWEETFPEFVHRLRQDPGHRWDHWWLAELDDSLGEGLGPAPVGALVGTLAETEGGPDGSYVSYIGVLDAARGQGVGKSLLRTIIADAAARGRDRVGLEVDADSPTGAEGLYTSLGWETKYVTESWHRDVPMA
ncbi:GNAT family N-acetyltransferase [Nocardioides sp.]|uniref:GNAT family N-acetyltransferase n=1 Tax=Nocardioides sp. TaxID=35761 RepID=UPI002ED3D35D